MNKPNAKRDLTKGDILAHVFRMAIPMTIGIGSIISFSLADTYFIGLLGATELAAIGYTFPVTTLLFNVVFGMAIAMSAVVSRKIGAGNMEDVRSTVTIGLAITFIVSTFLSVLGYLSLDTIFAGLGAGVEVMPIIKTYMPIWFIGAIFLSLPVVANSAIRGTGDAFWPAFVMVLVAVINIILNPILIFGLFGAPRLEVQGAAIASLIAYIIAAISALSILMFREKLVKFSCLFNKASWKISAKALLIIAIPVALGNVITPIISYGYTSILSTIGDEAVAGFGVATRFEAFALIPIMAMAGGIAPVIGQNYGAGLHHRVQEAMRKALKFAVLYAIGCAIFIAIIANPLATAFSSETIVHDFVRNYLLFIPMTYVGLNVFLVVTASMNAMERAKTSLTLNLIKSFVIALPSAWVLVKYYDAYGFFASIALTNCAALVVAVYCLKSFHCFQRVKTVI